MSNRSLKSSEIAQIFKILSAAYPKFDAFCLGDKLSETAKLWAEMLGDIPFDKTLISIKAHISSDNHPPTIADIRRKVAELDNSNEPDYDQALNQLRLAIKAPQTGIWASCEEERQYLIDEKILNSLSQRTRDAVNFMGGIRELRFRIDLSNHAVRAQFRDAYNTAVQRSKNEIIIPSDIKSITGKIAQRLSA